MNATALHSARPWVAAHRVLLALVVAAATIVIVLMTSSGSSPSSSVQAPDQGQIAPHVPGGAQPRNAGTPDIPARCLQHMGLQYMALVPC